MYDFLVELPFYAGEATKCMGGLNRLMQLANNLLTLELPHYNKNSGGIRETLVLSEELRKRNLNVCLRFQKNFKDVIYEKEDFKVPYSVGIPDSTFPRSKRVITYSDTPYGKELTNLPQVEKVGIYMLSYGMAIDRERANIKNPKMIVMTTTKRTKELIEKEDVICHKVGFGTDCNSFYIEPGIQRKKIAVLLYHFQPDKKYQFGVELVNKLCDEGLVDGVITFGTKYDYDSVKHPKKLIRHYGNATRAEIREIFSSASLFIMPSVTEGLNLTPMESTLCGCPAVLCDGAFDDLFFDKKNCLVATKNNFEDFYEKSKLILASNFNDSFRELMKQKVQNFTWEKTIKNILEVMK
jgi:glycosyltransferase involved in cell wall biosynthesis